MHERSASEPMAQIIVLLGLIMTWDEYSMYIIATRHRYFMRFVIKLQVIKQNLLGLLHYFLLERGGRDVFFEL